MDKRWYGFVIVEKFFKRSTMENYSINYLRCAGSGEVARATVTCKGQPSEAKQDNVGSDSTSRQRSFEEIFFQPASTVIQNSGSVEDNNAILCPDVMSERVEKPFDFPEGSSQHKHLRLSHSQLDYVSPGRKRCP
ncbi:hypothetical protein TNCV_2871331 [Trichonephila clavipes]|nr:hypothetical protein TNCV_2871331 [Trichonephila clavipes]